jgi:hypothetical protein
MPLGLPALPRVGHNIDWCIIKHMADLALCFHIPSVLVSYYVYPVYNSLQMYTYLKLLSLEYPAKVGPTFSLSVHSAWLTRHRCCTTDCGNCLSTLVNTPVPSSPQFSRPSGGLKHRNFGSRLVSLRRCKKVKCDLYLTSVKATRSDWIKGLELIEHGQKYSEEG